MGVSGNSQAAKSFQSFAVSEELLAKVVEAVRAGEKQARSSGNIQSFEVFYRGFRQNIAIGRIYVIPPSVCSDRKDFPTALLYGCLVRTFGGEEMGDLIERKIGETEFDEYSQADFDTIKEKLFSVGGDKFAALILFAPSWSNKRDYIAFHYTDDEAKLKNNLRHQVFACYFDPRLSSAFEALTTNVNTTKVDVTDITPKINFPFLAENLLTTYPDLQKQAGNKKRIALTRRTADAITQEALEPQEINVFESLDQALTEAIMPGTTSVEDAGEASEGGFTAPDPQNEVPRLASTKEAAVLCPKCETPMAKGADGKYTCGNCGAKTGSDKTADWSMKCPSCQGMARKADPQGEYKCPSCGWASAHGAATVDPNPEIHPGMHAQAGAADTALDPKKYPAKPKEEEKKKEACAPHETPFTNVGPGTEAHAQQEGMVKAVKEQVEKKEGEAPIGIAIDENGVPRSEAEATKVAADNPSNRKREVSHPETLRVDPTRLSSAYSAAYNGGFVDKHDMPPKKVRDYMDKHMSDNAAHAPQAAADHAKQIEAGAYGEDPLNRRSNEKWGSAKIPLKFAADYVAQHIAMELEDESEVISPKGKKARDEQEAKLAKNRQKQADVPLDIDSIWAEITEDMGPAPEITLPGDGGASADGGGSESTPSRPRKSDMGKMPESMTSDKPEKEKAMSDSEAKSQEDSVPKAKEEPKESDESDESEEKWHVSAKYADFVDDAQEEMDLVPAGRQRVSCNQCQMLSINGTPCHETGCPNEKKQWDAERQDWVRHFKCYECGDDVSEDEAEQHAEAHQQNYFEPEPETEMGRSAEGENYFEGEQRRGSVKKADTADNPYNMKDGTGAPDDKKNAEKPDTSGPEMKNTAALKDATPKDAVRCSNCKKMVPKGHSCPIGEGKVVPKKADAVQPDVAEAKAEVVSPDTVDKDIKQETKSVEEAAKVSADVSGDISEAKSELDHGAKAELADNSDATKTVNPEHFAGVPVGDAPDVPCPKCNQPIGSNEFTTTGIGGVDQHVTCPVQPATGEQEVKTSSDGAYEIVSQGTQKFPDAKWREEPQIVDHADDEMTAEYLVGEYTMAFGPKFKVWSRPTGSHTAAAGDDMPEEIPFNFGAGDLADIVMAEDEGTDGAKE